MSGSHDATRFQDRNHDILRPISSSLPWPSQYGLTVAGFESTPRHLFSSANADSHQSFKSAAARLPDTHVRNNQTFVRPTSVFVALSTTKSHRGEDAGRLSSPARSITRRLGRTHFEHDVGSEAINQASVLSQKSIRSATQT